MRQGAWLQKKEPMPFRTPSYYGANTYGDLVMDARSAQEFSEVVLAQVGHDTVRYVRTNPEFLRHAEFEAWSATRQKRERTAVSGGTRCAGWPSGHAARRAVKLVPRLGQLRAVLSCYLVISVLWLATGGTLADRLGGICRPVAIWSGLPMPLFEFLAFPSLASYATIWSIDATRIADLAWTSSA